MILATGNWRAKKFAPEWKKLTKLFEKHKGRINGVPVTIELLSGEDEALWGTLSIIDYDHEDKDQYRGVQRIVECGYGSTQNTYITNAAQAYKRICDLRDLSPEQSISGHWFRKIDTDNSQQIDFDEFSTWTKNRGLNVEYATYVFKNADDKSGALNMEEFSQACPMIINPPVPGIPITTLRGQLQQGSLVTCAEAVTKRVRDGNSTKIKVVVAKDETGKVLSSNKNTSSGCRVQWNGHNGQKGQPHKGWMTSQCKISVYANKGGRRRRMAQREFSNRRDSPVMVRLLQEIIDAQDD